MPSPPDGTSFYLFDFDDNIMFLTTPIFIRNTDTGEVKAVSTGAFASIHPQLGTPGRWENYAMFDGSYRRFRDIPADDLKPGMLQYFVEDVRSAIDRDPTDWKGPSWDLFVHACDKQRPLTLVTARGHRPETLKAGIAVLVEHELIPREPNYHCIYPVGNDTVRREQLEDPKLELSTPMLKKRAIIKSVDLGIKQYGERPHRFGMSDDDPQNVGLIIRAMVECKRRYLDKRFFVINTHLGEHVKLEVFPIDFPVAGNQTPEGPLG